MIDECWNNNSLIEKAEAIPTPQTKKHFKTIIIKIKDKPQVMQVLNSQEYEEFRNLQINYLGLGAQQVK